MLKKKRFNPSKQQSEEFKRLVRDSLAAGITDTNKIQIQLDLIKHIKVSKQSIRRWKRDIAKEPPNKRVNELEQIRDKEIIEIMKTTGKEEIEKVIENKPRLFKPKPPDTFRRGKSKTEYIKTTKCPCGVKHNIPAYQDHASCYCAECGYTYIRKRKQWRDAHGNYGYPIGAGHF